jgi:hypothetical protein
MLYGRRDRDGREDSRGAYMVEERTREIVITGPDAERTSVAGPDADRVSVTGPDADRVSVTGVDADRVSVTGVDAREAREIDRNSNIASITVDNEIRRIREQIEHTRSRIAEHEVQRVEEIQDPSLSKIV